MSIKQTLVKKVRSSLPAGGVHLIEEAYRRSRVQIVSAKYGFPAKDLKVIAVTGTNGKTTTCNYINEILKEVGFKTALFTTAVIEIDNQRQINDLNATVGTTDRMQRFFKDAKNANVDYVVLEITSHALDQHKLSTVPIEAAVMTNLTQDHLDYHKTMENYAAAKGKLFANKPKYIVLNRDDQWFDFFDEFEASVKKVSYGESKEADTHISHIKLYKKGSEADIHFTPEIHENLATAIPGKFNVLNMTAAASLAFIMGVKTEDIKEGIANLEGVPGRLESAGEINGAEVIIDYAHTPDALEKLLESLNSVAKNKVSLVFGATGDRDKEKRPIMGQIAAKQADKIFLTDEESYNENPDEIRKAVFSGIKEIKGGIEKTKEIADRKEAIRAALKQAKGGDIVVITGMGHEKFRIINGEKLPWNDGDVVRELIAEIEKEAK